MEANVAALRSPNASRVLSPRSMTYTTLVLDSSDRPQKFAPSAAAGDDRRQIIQARARRRRDVGSRGLTPVEHLARLRTDRRARPRLSLQRRRHRLNRPTMLAPTHAAREGVVHFKDLAAMGAGE